MVEKHKKYQEDEAVDFVYQTTDYSKFKNIQGNRVINVAHLERLKESFKERILKAVIYVNENFEIIDGQHRFQVLMQMKKPINYVVCEGYTLDEVQVYNQNSKNWATDDFLESYSKLGNEPYVLYKKFKEYHKLPNSALFQIFWRGQEGIHHKWKTGDIKITDENFKEANKVAYRLNQVRKIIGKIAAKREFVRAFVNINQVPDYNQEQMLHKLELFKYNVPMKSSGYEYVELLEGIYNFKQPMKDRLDIMGWLKSHGLMQVSIKKLTKRGK